jgi:phage shock protein A
MFKQFATLFRGQTHDAAEALTDANALSILRQQLRDAAAGVDATRRAVATVMAHAQRERNALARIDAQLADLESRALDALTKGRDDLATEAAGVVAQLEAERDTTRRAIATYETQIAELKAQLADSEARLRDVERGARLAAATATSQRLRAVTPHPLTADLAEAEGTLSRILSRQEQAGLAQAALVELNSAGKADLVRDRLAAAGIGAPLRPDAAAVLNRLKAKLA